MYFIVLYIYLLLFCATVCILSYSMNVYCYPLILSDSVSFMLKYILQFLSLLAAAVYFSSYQFMSHMTGNKIDLNMSEGISE